jgi:hypothetical protein
MLDQTPPPKKIRLFEPFVSAVQNMVAQEAPYLAHQLEECRGLSLEALEQEHTDHRILWRQANEELEHRLPMLDVQERAALQCLLARDLNYLFQLYLALVMSKTPTVTPLVDLPHRRKKK